MASSAIAKRSPIARTGLAYGDIVTIAAPTTPLTDGRSDGLGANFRGVPPVAPLVIAAGDKATGCARVPRAHRACAPARFRAAPSPPPRRRSPRPAAADRYFQPAAWEERYRRNQDGGCSTKRDNDSLDRVKLPVRPTTSCAFAEHALNA